MTPKTMKSSGNPTNRAQIERILSARRSRFCAFNTLESSHFTRASAARPLGFGPNDGPETLPLRNPRFSGSAAIKPLLSLSYLTFSKGPETSRRVSRGREESGKKAVSPHAVPFKRSSRECMLTELLGSSLPWSPSLLSECSTAVRK